MSIDQQQQQQHVALPKLYGASAYARPPKPVAEKPKPFDPDDLPITAFQTDEDRDSLEAAYAAGGVLSKLPPRRRALIPQPFRLRALIGRLLGAGSQNA